MSGLYIFLLEKAIDQFQQGLYLENAAPHLAAGQRLPRWLLPFRPSETGARPSRYLVCVCERLSASQPIRPSVTNARVVTSASAVTGVVCRGHLGPAGNGPLRHGLSPFHGRVN